MSSGNIKGITIEINGDTTKLTKALNDVDKRSRETNKTLREIDKSLKFNPGNVDLVAQKQRKLGDAIKETSEKLKILRQADEQAKVQLENGNLGQDEYDALQREILKTCNQLETYKAQLNQTESEQNKLSLATKGITAILESQGKSIDDVADIIGQDVVDAFKKGEGTSEQMAKALGELGEEFLNTGGDSAKLGEELKNLSSTENFDEIINDTKALNKGLNESSNASVELGEDLSSLEVSSDQFQGLNALSEIFGKLKDAIGDAISSIMDAWGKLDEGQDTIIAKTGATGEAAEKMGKTFTNVYSSMPAESQAVGDAIGELNTQFGLQGDELESATKKLLQYAEINGSDVTTATQSAKGAMDQFGLSANDLGSVLDVVTKAGQDTGVATEKLLDSVAQGAPTLRSLGLSFNESVVAMSQFEQSGINGSQALSYLTKAEIVAAGKHKTLNQVLDEFNEVVNTSTDEQKKLNMAVELFGKKGARRMIDAAKEGHLNFNKLKESVADAGGTIESTYDAMLDPVDNVTVAQHNLDIVLGDIGSTIQEAAAPAINALVSFLQKLSAGFTSLSPGVKTAIVVIAGLAAGFLAVVAVIATVQTVLGFLGPIITNITGIFMALKTAIGGIFAFVSANPIVLIIAAIVAAVALLITHWDTVKAVAQQVWDKIVEVWNGILDFISPIMDTIGSAISGAWQKIKTVTGTVWNGIKTAISVVWNAIKTVITTVIGVISGVITTVWNTIKTVTGTVWNGIKTVIDGVWNGIKTGVTTAINAVKSVIETVFNGIKTTVTNIWNGIKTTISGVWEGIKTGVSGAVEAVKTKVSNVFNGIKTTVTTIWNGIKEAISKPIEAARDLVKKAIDKIKGFFNFKFTWPKIPLPHFSFSGSINPFSGDFPPKIGLKWYKQGGIFDKPSVIGVGEAGSEAVVPTHKLDAFFDEALKRVGAKNNDGAQPPFIINVEKMIVRDDEDITKVAQELERLWRRERRRYV